ncbi:MULTISPECIES: DUF4873 domain-containing protein [unclassified Nocardioides]|uniref:DUF4873 domain-containing protein n=1 Tax=unclassified Nocardioides TaxID=2615069 RepID=UPI0006F67134|nr:MULTISPECIES: DUF4873 domain-containing protein [unclassified Nocardioides]KQY63539.1 hypothetical protein ASD30_00535 [Nocardioides sp. Root140]KRF17510.1 hypothetical protein ASH02_24905 [Nocardioides sp. Soil796]
MTVREHDPYELDEWSGAATVITEETEIPVEVTLRGSFQPIDGHFHWYGRIAPNVALSETCRGGANVAVRAGDLTAPARLSDVDPWGRFRVTGTGRPPFPAATSPAG